MNSTVDTPNSGWRDALGTLKRQIEARAERSTGLHHLAVEVADNERDKLQGPDWFKASSGILSGQPPSREFGKWTVAKFSGLPSVEPGFREVTRQDDLEDEGFCSKVVFDRSGTPRAVATPMRLRRGFFCGQSNNVAEFESLATAAAQILAGANDLSTHKSAADLVDLFRPPRGGVRYVFGDIDEAPSQFISAGWQASVLLYKNGVLIDVPIAESSVDSSHWLLLLHRLAWKNLQGSPLRGDRCAWEGSATISLDMLLRGNTAVDFGFTAEISKESFYSVLGTRDAPLDVNLASVFAVDLLLSKSDCFQGLDSALVDQLEQTATGNKDARKYHKLIAEIIQKLFLDELSGMTIEQEINEGRKRVDICFDNVSDSGFFNDLKTTFDVKCPVVFVECKNYSQGPANPELDQLLGRLGDRRGRFGMLVCREISVRKLMDARCKDAANAGQGYVLVLDDADIKTLWKLRLDGKSEEVRQFLRQCMKKLLL